MSRKPRPALKPRRVYTLDEITYPNDWSKIGRRDTDLTTRITKNVTIARPMVGSPMKSVCNLETMIIMAENGSMGFFHTDATREERLEICREMVKRGLLFGMAITCDDVDFVLELKKAGCRIFRYDAANAAKEFDLVKFLTIGESLGEECECILGNLTSAKAMEMYANRARHVLKGVWIGYGPGQTCTSRGFSGGGTGQATATWDVCQITREIDIPGWTDGGISLPGHIVRALLLGAEGGVCGSVFNKVFESAGGTKEVLNPKTGETEIWARHFGMGSKTVLANRNAIGRYVNPDDDDGGEDEEFAPEPEGEDGWNGPVTRSLKQTILWMSKGIRAGMANMGARTVKGVYAPLSKTRIDYQEASGILESGVSLRYV